MDDTAIIGVISDIHGLLRQETLTALKRNRFDHACPVMSAVDHAARQRNPKL
jgi:hypothetical protein